MQMAFDNKTQKFTLSWVLFLHIFCKINFKPFCFLLESFPSDSLLHNLNGALVVRQASHELIVILSDHSIRCVQQGNWQKVV